ncbi:MAG: hypothetical protein J6K29_03380, partial [Clostridia bacterium]|nr:hypothetical protein [Clostridia bacterium]
MKQQLTKKTRKRLIVLTVILELILAALVIYGFASGTLLDSLAGGMVVILLLLIPVLLVALLIAVVFGKKKPDTAPEASDPRTEVPADPDTDSAVGRFCMLTRIEENRYRYGHPRYDTGITLERFCEDFRNYA